MAITIPTTGPGTITPAVATESNAAGHFQHFKLIDGNVGSLDPVGTSANPLRILPTNYTQAVTGSVVVSQSGIATIIGSIGVSQLGGAWSMVGSTFSTNVGNVAHDAADTGNPVKIGAFAVDSTFPTPVGSGDRVNVIADHHGRLIVTGVAQNMAVHKSNDYTGPLSGTVVWSANVNGQLNITTLRLMAGSGTSGIVTVFFAGSGPPINYTVGSGVAVFRGEMAPSATTKPGVVIPFGLYPCKPGALNDALRISITTAMQVYLQVDGYEEF